MAQTVQIRSGRRIIGWILAASLAFVYVFAGGAKTGLMGAEAASETAANFERWGYAAWFMMLVGAAELAGAFGLLIPRLSTLAACGLMILMCGAVFTHANHGENEAMVPPLVLLVLLGVTALVRSVPASRGAGARGGKVGSAAEAGANHRAA